MLGLCGQKRRIVKADTAWSSFALNGSSWEFSEAMFEKNQPAPKQGCQKMRPIMLGIRNIFIDSKLKTLHKAGLLKDDLTLSDTGKQELEACCFKHQLDALVARAQELLEEKKAGK